jgi:hypothetical protein
MLIRLAFILVAICAVVGPAHAGRDIDGAKRLCSTVAADHLRVTPPTAFDFLITLPRSHSDIKFRFTSEYRVKDEALERHLGTDEIKITCYGLYNPLRLEAVVVNGVWVCDSRWNRGDDWGPPLRHHCLPLPSRLDEKGYPL